MNIFYGKPSDIIIEWAKKHYGLSYSNDQISQIIDKALEKAPPEVKASIEAKQVAAKAANPSLQDGCEDLNAIAITDLANNAGIDIMSLIGKESPTTEDDDAIITKQLNK